MPADAFPLAVFVGRQNQLGGILEGQLELGDDFALILRDDVDGLEVVFDIDAERRPGLFLLLDFFRDF